MEKIAIVVVLLALPVNAGIYKWTDESGNVHYSDHAVNQHKVTELNVDARTDAGVTNSADSRERDLVIQELEEDRKARAKRRDEKQIAQKNKQKRCALAKDDLRRYRNANAIYKLDTKGERVYYSREQRQNKEQEINRLIAKNCR